MVQIVCTNVEKHSVNMMEELHRMKKENDHCDFIIHVGDDVYYTHKNILSAGSAYFKAMLKHDTKESREGKVFFKEVDSMCVKNCIDFIYSGKFDIPEEKMNDLLHVAIMMQLDDVEQAVSDILEESINVENYFSTRNVADMYGLDAVSTRCRAFFLENIMEISNQPEFGNTKKTYILNYMKSKKSMLCEEDKLTLLFNWVEKNGTNQKHLHKCLKAIKFDKVSPSFLERLLKSNQIISNDLGLYKLINGHLLQALKGSHMMNEEIGNDELIILFDEEDCIKSFNPVTEKVEKFHHETWNSGNSTAISLDSYIYVLCENKSVHRLNFQSKNSKWERMKDIICDHGPLPRAVSSSRSIFVVGGSCDEATSDVEIFTPLANQWIQLKDTPTAICDASLVSLDDSIYSIGGKGQDGVTVSSFSRSSSSASEWVDLDPMRYPVSASGVVAVDQKIFVIGGWSGGMKYVDNVECYDITSAQWTSLSSMNDGHYLVYAYHINKCIFAVALGETSDAIDKYDISQDKWTIVKLKADQCSLIFKSVFVKR